MACGATGSGKSTLLQCAAGLERPSAGVVRLAGRDVGRMSERARTRFRGDRVGFVFQSYNLLFGADRHQQSALHGATSRSTRLTLPSSRCPWSGAAEISAASVERRFTVRRPSR